MASSGAYQVLHKDQEALIKDINKGCTNKWKFQWLEEEVHVTADGVDRKVKIGDSVVKINVPGKASCEWCHSLLSYKGKGLSTLRDHMKTKGHVHQIKTRLTNYSLRSFVQQPSKANLFPMFRTSKLLDRSKITDTTPSPCAQSSSSSVANNESAPPVAMVPLCDGRKWNDPFSCPSYC